MVKKGNGKQQNKNQEPTELELLKKKITDLEDRVVKLECKNAVLTQVTEVLRKEVDRLDQYGRRSNVVIRNVEVPNNETQEHVEQKVDQIIGSLNVPNATQDIDKTHRIGRVKIDEKNNKKYQNIVVRFRSHRTRYAVYTKRKDLQNNVKLNPHLTQHRGKVLHDSVEFCKEIDGVDYTFANLHGDLCVRLSEKVNDKNIIKGFNTLDELQNILIEKNLVDPVEDESSEE